MIDASSTFLGVFTFFIGVPLNLAVVLVLRQLNEESSNPLWLVLAVLWVGIVALAFVFGIIFMFNDGLIEVAFLDAIGTKLPTRALMAAFLTVPAVVLLLWLAHPWRKA